MLHFTSIKKSNKKYHKLCSNVNTTKPVMCKNYKSNCPVFVRYVPSFNILSDCAFWNTHLMATINHKSLTDSKTKLRTGLCMWVTWTQENVSMGDSLYLSFLLFYFGWGIKMELWRNQALKYNRKTCSRPGAVNIEATNMVAYTDSRFQAKNINGALKKKKQHAWYCKNKHQSQVN